MLKEGNVTVMVADMKRAIQFYTETLGFKAGPIYGEEWATINAPSVKIGLHPAREVPKIPKRPGHISLGFTVEDLDEATGALEKKGLKFTFKEDEAARFAFFEDPDNTPLYLCEL